MHDKNGTALQEGDIVLVQMRVKSLSAQDDFCNCTLESVHGRRPDGTHETVSSVNTGVVVLFDREAS